MNIEYKDSKNGEKTFSLNSIFFHSSYNPLIESQRFVDNIQFEFKPSIIFVIEAGLGYALPLLKKKFPETKIVSINLIKDLERINISTYNYNFDNKFKNNILKNFTEEELILSQMITFISAEKFFKEEIFNIWKVYKESLEHAKTILVTRQFFEKKWLLNSINFHKYWQNQVILSKKINIPIIITASGPSLKNSLNIIRENQEKIFIIALSSSISTLIKNNINFDLAFTSDGGYWAGRHLKKLEKNNCILATSTEAFIQKNILKKNNILLLNYQDGISAKLIEKLKVTYTKAQRNGSVSGSALDFALENSNESPIYFCGLDLASNKGFQHINPNEIEIDSSIKDNRLKTSSTRLYKAEINDYSLNIYKEWFINKKVKNCFRVIDNKYKKNNLNNIQDISYSNFEKQIQKYNNYKKENYFEKINKNDKAIASLNEYINQIKDSDDLFRQLFPIDYCNLIHREKSHNYNDFLLELAQKKNKLIKKIRTILDGK